MSTFEDIYVDLDAFDIQDLYPIVHLLEDFRCYELGALEDSSTMSTVIGHRYMLNFYESFRNLVNGYLDFLIRDLCSVADMAASLVQYDNQMANGIVGVGYLVANEFNRSDYDPSVLTLTPFSVDSDISLSDTWEFYKSEMDVQIATIESNLILLLLFIPNLKEKINHLSTTSNFTGAAADAAKNYFATIHSFACDALYVCAQNAYAWISQYWVPYRTSRQFEADGTGTCVIFKTELTDLVTRLESKRNDIEEWYPGIAEHNTSLATNTNNEYDYSNSLTCLYSLPEHIDGLIADCNSLIDCVEEYEPFVLSYIAPQLENVCQEFYNFASQLTGLTRDDFISPPPDISAVYNLEQYSADFAEIQANNEVNMAGVMSDALDETNEINTELAIEARMEQRGYEILGCCVTILAAAASIVVTCGTDSGAAIVVIGSCGDILFSCAEIYENIDEIEMLRSGDIDPEGFNFIRDGILSGIDDPEDRQIVYVVVRRVVGSSPAVGAVGEASLVATGGDDNLVELIMIPVDLALGDGISADYQGAVDGFGTVAGAACNVAELSVDDNYDEWVISYNNARSSGIVGGAGFVVGGSNVQE